MRKLYFILIGLSVHLAASAITQQGMVRTISRPNRPSENLEGVLVRVRGNHNAVISESTGLFSILMQELQNGDPYCLSAVMKSGYQLSEQDIIGRQQAGSDRVPLEIAMVSTSQLQEEKNAIAAKAREGVERYYTEQIMAIEQALAKQQLTNEQYEQRIAELDNKLMQSEQQIEQMADRYARTDYALLDSVAGAIQSAIEQGDLDAAEQMILRKGSLTDRHQRIVDMRRDVKIQEQDLKQDYYHLHSIALSRFQPDSAAYYLQLRADIDTTDAAAQLDYAKFLNEYMRSTENAWYYTQRAERQVRKADGEHSMLMLRVLCEGGQCLYLQKQYLNAASKLEYSLALCLELYGKDHKYTATRRVCLGASYYGMKKYKEAKKQFNEALRIFHIEGQEDDLTEATTLNNLAGIAFAENDYALAKTYFEESATLLQSVAPNSNTLPPTLANIAATYVRLGDKTTANQYYTEAYTVACRIFGETNSFTKYLKTRVESIK